MTPKKKSKTKAKTWRAWVLFANGKPIACIADDKWNCIQSVALFNEFSFYLHSPLDMHISKRLKLCTIREMRK